VTDGIHISKISVVVNNIGLNRMDYLFLPEMVTSRRAEDVCILWSSRLGLFHLLCILGHEESLHLAATRIPVAIGFQV
jgi:hypothetical protein